MKTKLLCIVVFFIVNFVELSAQNFENDAQLDYLNVQLEKAHSLKNTGVYFAYGGTFLAGCSVLAFLKHSNTAGPFLAAGAAGWLAGGVMINFASSKIRNYKERKASLSFYPSFLKEQPSTSKNRNGEGKFAMVVSLKIPL